MIQKKKCIAMLLAGGQGSRLHVLTKNIAKPAVPFGGKYRIIDFTLSNCINSNISVVGVLTQYEPLVLNRYIRNGQPWDLDRLYGGVYTLPPYQKNGNSQWYEGTANAIYQNISFIEQYDPEYVLILSGDHIYTMDYSKMLSFHEEKNADITIAVINVSLKDASRFGIVCTEDGEKINGFQEKPKEPKSTLASMGIYIFKWEKLRQYLIEDEADEASSKDFGKNIIPKMLENGENMYAYSFEGYWKDVGTIDSLWEANMDILNNDHLKLNDPDWKIYARNPIAPPHYAGEKASTENSIVSEGSELNGTIRNSVIFYNVKTGEGSEIGNSVVMQNTVVGKNAKIYNAIIAEHVTIQDGAIIGEKGEGDERKPITVVGSYSVIKSGEKIPAGKIIDRSEGDENL